MSVLADILEVKAQEVARGKRETPSGSLEERARAAPRVRPFSAALRAASGCAVIAEIKKASPSKGVIRERFDPSWLARRYEAGGAACLSVLTDRRFFQGDPAHLQEARRAVSLPALRKDFMIDPWQVAEARALGADCILVILAAVDDARAGELADAARHWGMDALFETHDARELERARALGAALVGINNRSLATFRTDLATFESLAPAAGDALLVAESGIFVHADMQRLVRAGARACLVGESLMRAEDPCAALRALRGETVEPPQAVA